MTNSPYGDLTHAHASAGDVEPIQLAQGRVTLHAPVGVGGMATVHIATLRVDGGTRTVAVKRPHPHLTANPAFMAALVDEARLSLRLKHPNIVETLEVVLEPSDLLLVMEYVHGESLAELLASPGCRGVGLAPAIAAAIVVGIAEGLHAAHEASDDSGPLGIVHRDVSPQNILVGIDGRPRVLDFGVAKATGRLQVTREDQLKGKLRYMAPESLEGLAIDRRADIFALGMVFWECLTGERAVSGDGDGAVIRQLLAGDFAAPSTRNPAVSPQLDAVVKRAVAVSPADRPQTAAAFAAEIRAAITPASEAEVAQCLRATAHDALARREAGLRRVEAQIRDTASGVHTIAPSLEKDAPRTGDRRTRSRGPLALLAVVAVSGLATAAVLAARGFVPTPLDTVEPTSAASVPEVPQTPDPSSGASVGSPSADDPALAPEPSAAAVTVAAAASSKVAPHVRRPPRRTSPACTPPYTIDARGIQHFKRECLKPR